MQINRYSKPTPAQYNPMGLEELMMVPMQKRRQHDQLNQNIATTRTALAQADYMDMHDGEVSKVKQKLERELARQVDQVSSGGINDTLRTDFMNLNAEYQAAVGPKGVYGRAASAKASVAKAREEGLANAVQLGHDPEKSLESIQERVDKYASTQVDGKISDMETVAPPSYEDLDEDLKNIKDRIGSTTSPSGAKEGYKIGYDKKLDQFYAETETGTTITQDDHSQIGDALKGLSVKWLTKGGAGYRSDEWNKVDHVQRFNELISTTNSMKTKSVTSTKEQNIEFLGAPGGTDDPRDANPNEDILYEETQEIANTVFSNQSVQESKAQIKALREEGTPESIADARRLEYHMFKLENDVSKTLEWTNLTKEEEEYLAELTPAQVKYVTNRNSAPYGSPETAGSNNMTLTQEGTNDKITVPANEYFNHTLENKSIGYNDIIAKKNDVLNKGAKTHTIDYMGYVVDKRGDTEAKWRQYAGQVVNSLVSRGQAGSEYSVDSFIVGTEKHEPNDSSTSTELFRLLGKGENVEIGKFYADGSSNEPMIELSFNLPEGDEVNDEKNWDTTIPKGERVTLRVNLGKFEGENAESIKKLFISPLSQFGGKKGAYLAEAIVNSANYKNITASGNPNDFSQSAEIKKAVPFLANRGEGMINLHRIPSENGSPEFQYNMTTVSDEKSLTSGKSGSLLWNHIITPEILSNPKTMEQLPSKLIDGFTANFIKFNEGGINLENISNMNDAELDAALQNFLKFYGEQPIKFASKEEALLSFKE